MVKSLLRNLVLLTLIVGVGACAVNPVTGKPDIVLTSEAGEISRAKKVHEQILEQMPVYKDPELQAYVDKVGQRVAKIGHRAHLDYTFTVIDSPDFNAFTTGGGYVYIHRGLLTHLKSEAELAAVLGHEVGHVTARHYERSQSASTGAQVLSVLATIATRSRAVGQMTQVGSTALVRGYGREYELEADRLGAEYLYKSGYNPQAMIDVVSVLKDNERYSKQLAKEEGREIQTYHGLFSTHPRNDIRLKEAIAAAGQFQGGTNSNSDAEFRAVMNGLEYGDSTDTGVRRGNRFYHRQLDFTLAFPKGWEINNGSNSLTAFPRSQSAFIELRLAGDLQDLTPETFISERLKVTNLEQGMALSQSGLTGYTGIVPETANRPSMRIAVIFHKERAYLFRGMKREGETANFDPFFLASIMSFRPMKDSEFSLATGQQIKYIKVKPGLTYARLAKSSPIEKYAEEKLRLINGDYPRGEPKAGEWIKVVVEGKAS